MADPIVQLKDIAKTIRKQTIVQNVQLSVLPGQVLALCGGNGAGKSTILRMVAGMMQPTSGTIEVNGIKWKENRKRYAEQIGYMPDDYRFGPGLTALETLTFWASLRGLPKSRAEEVLADVGLTDTGRKPVASFSKGMRQRVLFAQALLARPPVLIMDEPTNGLDPYWMDSFVKLVQAASDAGQAVIFSTHQLEIAEALAQRVAFLRQGQIELEGAVEDIRVRLGSKGLHDAFASMFGIQRTAN